MQTCSSMGLPCLHTHLLKNVLSYFHDLLKSIYRISATQNIYVSGRKKPSRVNSANTGANESIYIHRPQAMKSSGLLNPPFLFIYCLYFLFWETFVACAFTEPPVFFPLVESKEPNPIVFIISISSSVLPCMSSAGGGKRRQHLVEHGE